MSFVIRAAEAADAAKAVEVVRAVYDEYGFTWDEGDYHADLYDLKTHYLDAGHRFWIAEDGGRALGVVALEIFERIPGDAATSVLHGGKVRVGGADCSLERLYVRPDCRRGGVGTALFQTCLHAGRSLGRSLMEIWSDKRFEAAHRLYGRFNAVTVGERICDDPDESPEWGLAVKL
jgi:putative acetyltransferase